MTKTRDLADLGGGFIQPGSGAVQRTVESKLQDMVSVKDFGAVGDGVTDDTAAIQAAIEYVYHNKQGADSEGYAPVLFPNGDYKITDSIKVFMKLTLMGMSRDTKISQYGSVPAVISTKYDGTTYTDTLNATSSDVASKILHVTNLQINDLFFESKVAITGNAPSGAAYRATVQINGAIGLRMYGCRVTNSFVNNNGFTIENSWRAIVEDCYANGVGKGTLANSGGGYGFEIGGQVNAATFKSCQAVGWDVCYYLGGSQSTTFLECEAANSRLGWRLSADSIKIYGGYSENTGTIVCFGPEGGAAGTSAVNCSVDGLLCGFCDGAPGGPEAVIEFSRCFGGYVRNLRILRSSDYTDVGKTIFKLSGSPADSMSGTVVEVNTNTANPFDLSSVGLNGGNLIVDVNATGTNKTGAALYTRYSSYDGKPATTGPEIGYFTPTFSPSGITLSAPQRIRYVKEHSLVNLSGAFQISSNSNSSGTLNINNLPFSSIDLGNGQSSAVLQAAFEPPIAGLVGGWFRINTQNTNDMFLWGTATNGSRVDMGNIPAGTTVYITGHYLTGE